MKVVVEMDEHDYNTMKKGLLIVGVKDGKPLDEVLDEIRAELEKLDGMYVIRDHAFYMEKDPKYAGLWYVRLKEVIDIIDKYIGGKEVKKSDRAKEADAFDLVLDIFGLRKMYNEGDKE